MLLAECDKTGLVEIKTSCEVKAINTLEDQGFQVATNIGYFEAESVVIASGGLSIPCLLYTSDAADERSRVDLGGRRFIKKKKKNTKEEV